MYKKILVRLILMLAVVGLLAACGGGATQQTGASDSGTAVDEPMEGMDQSEMASGDVPFDAQFIDGMIEHHQGAVMMAEQALEESERPEIRELSQTIIATQQVEIQQMTAWRDAWYPDLPASEGMAMDMGQMTVSDDTSLPFDQRFLTAMISHHQGAIEMARAAQEQAEHAELRTLAEEIITAQEAEIAQMQAWLSEWYGV
ncbi:MAG: DUF305 domain-containing protein [Geodermatophilaceae bacterium]|nr:DUF305 domain-containing protein [Geodermatophilaceae bacterium]